MKGKPILAEGKVDGKTETHKIDVPGIHFLERLTPKMAAQAALIAFGHRCGITVCDGASAYRVYAHSHRKLSGTVAFEMSREWQQKVVLEMRTQENAQDFLASLDARVERKREEIAPEGWQVDAIQAAQDEADEHATQAGAIASY